jgi:hypothetical protein
MLPFSEIPNPAATGIFSFLVFFSAAFFLGIRLANGYAGDCVEPSMRKRMKGGAS